MKYFKVIDAERIRELGPKRTGNKRRKIKSSVIGNILHHAKFKEGYCVEEGYTMEGEPTLFQGTGILYKLSNQKKLGGFFTDGTPHLRWNIGYIGPGDHPEPIMIRTENQHNKERLKKEKDKALAESKTLIELK